MGKTPQFDKALDEYFAKLELDEKGGQWRICRFSGEKFYVRPEDVEFYKMIRVPLPTVAPAERTRMKLAYDNSYFLFRGKSAYSGKPIISLYPPGSPYRVYEHQLWYSDQWNPLDFGREYNSSRSFFEQFQELRLVVPRPNLISSTSNVDSEYTNVSKNLKNCYLTFWVDGGENLGYIDCCEKIRDSYDGIGLNNCSDCSNILDGWNLFNCHYCEYSRDCLDSYFLVDCRNCTNCFMCSNLRNKKYCFFNEQLTKEEYEKRIRAINLGNYKVLQAYKEKFDELRRKAVYRANHKEHTVDSYGEWLLNCKNCYECYFVRDSENCAYVLGSARCKDCFDCFGGFSGERCYEFMNGAGSHNYDIKFSYMLDASRSCEYSEFLTNCENCFGCVGLSNRKFCILNVQYTQEEYWKQLDEIKTMMLERGEYGEFFPKEMFPFPYNVSLAYSFPGYDDLKKAQFLGYRVENIQDVSQEATYEIVAADDLPADISDVTDDILRKAIWDQKNDLKFRIIRPELEFYRRHNLPLPRIAPMIRFANWRKRFTIRVQMYPRSCARCGKSIETPYPPDAPEKNIWCEECYRVKSFN